MEDSFDIPLCRSEFLQDLCIELGLRFTPRSNPFAWFRVEADCCTHEGEELERLSLWAGTPYGTRADLTAWEDGTLWVNVRLEAGLNNPEYQAGFYPDSAGLSPAQIIEAFRDTVSLTTRLCYAESPLPTMRKIWRHKGDVKVTGRLLRSGTSKA